MKHFLAILLFSLPILTQSQSQSIRVGLEYPLQYSFGLEDQFHESWSYYGQGGLMAFPLGNRLLAQWKTWGGDKQITQLLKTNYQWGSVLGVGGHYFFDIHTKMNYTGPFVQWINTYKCLLTDKEVEETFHVNLSTFPIGPIPHYMSKEPLSFSTHILNAGWQVGRRIPLRKEGTEFRIEVAVSKNFLSRTVIDSDYRIFSTSFKDRVNQELREYYHKHAWIATFNIYYIYKFKFKRFA